MTFTVFSILYSLLLLPYVRVLYCHGFAVLQCNTCETPQKYTFVCCDKEDFNLVCTVCTIQSSWIFSKAKFQCRTTFKRYTISTMMQHLSINALDYNLNEKCCPGSSVLRTEVNYTRVITFQVNTLTRNVSFSYMFRCLTDEVMNSHDHQIMNVLIISQRYLLIHL